VRPGDLLVLALGMIFVVWLFTTYWQGGAAGKVRIRQGDTVFATLSLNQERVVDVPGPLGVSQIVIHNHQARFQSSPCRNQYCVHQGWLSHAGQIAVCLPNRVTLELVGEKGYDSLNY
jgi:hypothetical protein